MGKRDSAMSGILGIALALTFVFPAGTDNKKEAVKHFRAGLALIEKQGFAAAAIHLNGFAVVGAALGTVLFFIEGKPKEREKTGLSVVPAWSSHSAGLQLIGRFERK